MGCARLPQPQTLVLSFNQGGQSMEKFIHKENLVLFKKRLAEPHTDAEREVLLKLLADEKAKEPLPEKKHSQAALICIEEKGTPRWDPPIRLVGRLVL